MLGQSGFRFAWTMNDGPYGFTGQWRDSETELYDLRARMYSPRLGSFASRDPLEGDIRFPLSLNLYAYVRGDVANYRDPSGLQLEPELVVDADEFGGTGGGFATWAVGSPGGLQSWVVANPVLDAFIRLSRPPYVRPPGVFVAQPGTRLSPFYTGAGQGQFGFTAGVPGRVEGVLTHGDARVMRDPNQELLNVTCASPALDAGTAPQARREVAQRDEAAIRRDNQNGGFDLALGLATYSEINRATPGADLLAFSASFRPRRVLPFIGWPDWMLRANDGVGLISVLSRASFQAGFHGMVRVFLANIAGGQIRFNLSGMEYRAPDVENLTNWELVEVLRYYRQETRFYHFDPASSVRTELQGRELDLRLAEITVPR
jgi:RHS repeat-associated protein